MPCPAFDTANLVYSTLSSVKAGQPVCTAQHAERFNFNTRLLDIASNGPIAFGYVSLSFPF